MILARSAEKENSLSVAIAAASRPPDASVADEVSEMSKRGLLNSTVFELEHER